MGLKLYCGKCVRIVDVDGETFEGRVTDYIYPGGDDTELESIIIDCTKGKLEGRSVEFWERDIQSINEVLTDEKTAKK